MVWILIAVFALLLVASTPIAFAMGAASVAAITFGTQLPLVLIGQRIFTGVDSFPLLAVPLFILAGALMETGGVSQRLVDLAKVLVGHVTGGLGMVVVISEIFFSGISGSTTADVSAIGSLMIPALKRSGYSPASAVSIVSAASAMGILVPPCIMMVILASMANLSIGALFIAGFLPAFVIAAFIMAWIYLEAKRSGLRPEPRPSRSYVLRALWGSILPLTMPVIIFGGILGGVFTATEAAAVAVVYGFVITTFVYKEMSRAKLVKILIDSAVTTAVVLFLIGTASVFAWLLASQQVPRQVGAALTSVSSSPLFFLVVSNLVFILLGAILEGMPALVILIPVFLPLATALKIDLLQYGILVIASIGVGLFLPPIGVGALIASRLGGIKIQDMARSYAPYMLAMLIGLGVITLVPWFTLVVPGIIYK